MSGVGPGDRRGGRTDDFTQRLGDLKGRGSAVLVTGGGSKSVHGRMARRLLGVRSEARRYRLVALTNGTLASESELASGELDVDGTVTAATTRSACSSPPDASTPDVDDVGEGTLADLGEAITRRVEGVERDHGPLEPTELRVGVDSVAPLLDAYGERAVFEFLVYATGYVRYVDALGHVHLPLDRGEYAARLLAPLFDAVVEVRVHRGQDQQRWHLDDGSVSSRWLPI